jgi:hypothetical protein
VTLPSSLLDATFVSESKLNINAQLDYFNLYKFPYGNGMKWEWTLSLDFHDQTADNIPFGSSWID